MCVGLDWSLLDLDMGFVKLQAVENGWIRVLVLSSKDEMFLSSGGNEDG